MILQAFALKLDNAIVTTGAKLADQEPIVEEGTVYQITKTHIVVLTPARFLYYMPWKGTERGFKDLYPGALVRIYRSGGFDPEIYTIEQVID